MIVEFGHFLLALALAAALTQTALCAYGAKAWSGRALSMGVAAAHLQAALLAGAFAALIYAFASSDFSVVVVAENSHTDKPLIYKIAAAWGHHEGSMLLWVLLLAAFGAAVARDRALPSRFKGWSLAVQGGIGVLFSLFLIVTSNPFARLATAPINGRDLNPLLQDPALAIHPPMLYVGYVGSSVVFAFAAAGLIEGRIDAAWAKWARPWALLSWTALTIGIALGSYWAYYELGWGGWWYWDPVENASFMPWLLGAALVHSIIITQRREALKSWTALLAILTFSLSLLGTFLVRSGVLTSVHAFALDPERGVAILAILGLLTGGGLALFAWRAPSLTPGGAFAPISREGAIVVNNLFLSISCAAILIGTLYPLALEAATGETISVGPPYFNLTFGLLMAPLLVAAPFGPFLGLGQADSAAAARRLLVAAGAALVAAAATAFAVFGDGAALAAIGVGVGVWLIAGAAADFGARIGLTLRGLGEAPGLIARARPGQWASALGHAGLGVLMLGVVGSSLWRSELVEVIEVGGSHEIAGFTVTLDSVASERGANYLAQRARFSVTRGDTDLGTLSPERRFYPAARSSTAEVAIRRGLVGDFYVVLGDQRPNGARVVQAYYFPLISFIYLGAGMIAAGGATAFAARRRASAAPVGDAAVAARQPAE